MAQAEGAGGRVTAAVRRRTPQWRRLVNRLRRRFVDVATYDILARQMSKPVRMPKQPLEGLEMRLVEPGSVKVRGGGAVLGDPIGAERMMRRGNATRLWWAGTLDGEVIGRVIAIIPGPGERRGANVLGRTLAPADAYITGLWIDPRFRNRNVVGSLVAPWLEQLRERGVETLWGTVNRRNRPSRILAHILGFHAAGELVRFELFGGRWKWRLRSSFDTEERA